MPAFPYLAKATIKYKSPHKQDLTFAKGETIRVTGLAPKTDPSDDDDDDDDDWLVGETLDGARSGTFPGSFVEPSDEVEATPAHETEAKIASATSAPSAPGAIPTEVPDQLQSSVVEETPSHQAEVVPEAAREAARKGETEQAGFGAPLPPRPASPDQNEEQTQDSSATQTTAAETPSDSTGVSDVSKAAVGGAAAVGVATGAVAATATSDAPKADASSSTASSPVKSPPAVASKPVGMSSSFRDRLAAFNKPTESAPPPLPKGKPGGWKRPTPATTEAKPLLPGAPAAAPSAATPKPAAAPAVQPTETSEAPASSEPSGGGGGAFSAADAQTSIKMSLKERMAALQRNEAAAADAAPQLKPKPAVPGKIGADRRNVAMQGMGLAPGAPVPVRKSSVESGRSIEEPGADTAAPQEGSEAGATAVTSEEAGQDASAAAAKEAGAVEEGPEQTEDSGEPKEALTEEEQEAERRAAIAKRMAALGARRMGGAPVPFGAPAPPNRTKTTSSVGSAEGTSSEPGIALPTESAATAGKQDDKEEAVPTASSAATAEEEGAAVRSPVSPEAEEEPKVLAVPRRTAAPRKRKPVAQTAAVAAGAPGAAAVGGAALAESSDSATPAAPAAAESEPSVEHPEAAAADPAEEASSITKEEEVAEASLDDGKVDTTAIPSADAVHPEESEDVALHQDGAAEQLEDSDPEIAENQRQLEEYLRGEGFYEDQVEAPAEHEPAATSAAFGSVSALPAAEAEPEANHADETAPREDVTSPKPPSRPPSTRPPIPKTSLPPPPAATAQDDALAARAQSPSVPAVPASLARPASVVPPVPTSALPVPVETADEEVNEPEPEAETFGVEQDAGPVLAAPKPRMAVPTEDPEDAELLAAADAPAAAQEEHTEAPAAVAEEQPEEQELTEEEQEAQRRANLARRMAALGGQRIGAFPGMAPPPIMGAPMPARKAPVQAAEETEDASREPEDGVEEEKPLSPIRGPPRGGMVIPGLTAVPGMNAEQAEGDALERAKSPGAASVDAPARLASPPPVPMGVPSKPTSPPPPARPLPTAGGGGESTLPPTLPPGRPSSAAPMPNLDEAIRSASPANSSLGRRGSMKPPVPQGFSAHSRESSLVAAQETAGDRELTTSPPPLPVSPPPRPSSRAPPLPGLASVPPRRQGSSASYTSVGEHGAPSSTTTTPATEVPTSAVPPPRTEASLPPTPAAGAPSNINVGARQSSRDLDLMPSSRWWRHGVNPLRLPPTVAGRPDAILYADTSSSTDTGVAVHRADIYMLFEDYSTTVISLCFQDDDLEEAHTSLTQRHNFAPAKPSSGELKQWSSAIGSAIAKLASDAAKQSSAPVGDGSARAFVQHVIASLPHALPPVGTSLGALLLTQVGPTVMETGADEIRAGDIVFASQADFKGKKGLAPYHTTLGNTEPSLGVVVDVEAKKNKLRCVIQSPATKRGTPEELSLRFDDLKSGIVKVFRVPPRQGWVADW
ncbi:uncharacterized protein SRS1_10186 [Sporisorium reilianum f. sp. reilianum]|uniref:SH3 domain-containing protein n=1 Tax=Sporisorium reilianum f. sp. reilianum TaxID=72559 RepID=A0A2N8U8C2_9BASI|nr:uncharacterized protein SRS1_10186 [Sporisorium reilianum f. sp. reilianum]